MLSVGSVIQGQSLSRPEPAVSDCKAASSLANGRNSQGPRSSESKQNSKMNAFQHRHYAARPDPVNESGSCWSRRRRGGARWRFHRRVEWTAEQVKQNSLMSARTAARTLRKSKGGWGLNQTGARATGFEQPGLRFKGVFSA